MKHLLNFVPTVKFRQGSSFMFKTIYFLLWAIPIMISLFMTYEYYGVSDTISFLSSHAETLDKRYVEYQNKFAENRLDPTEIEGMKKRMISYCRTFQAFSFSWTPLFEILERIIPAGLKITQIRIKPESLIKLAIQGEAVDLEKVTQFLRTLHSLEQFSKPRLTRHALLPIASGTTTTFYLDVDYVPQGEVTP